MSYAYRKGKGRHPLVWVDSATPLCYAQNDNMGGMTLRRCQLNRSHSALRQAKSQNDNRGGMTLRRCQLDRSHSARSKAESQNPLSETAG